MDKIRSILSSSSGKKVGPPVPPRPPISAVQKALEKSRNQSHNFPQPAVPIAKGRTVIYTSSNNNSNNINGQQPSSVCENKCFDTKSCDSSTGLKVIVKASTTVQPAVPLSQNGKTARVHDTPISTPSRNELRHPLMHHKSPVPRPRLKTPPSSVVVASHPQPAQPKNLTEPQQNGNYTRLLMHNQNNNNLQHVECIETKRSGKSDQRNRDDELKEKLLNEIFSGRLVEASNVHIRYNGTGGSNLKRSSSVDVLNDRNSMILSEKQQLDEKSKDRKVMFHEMLISELSEMRRAGNDTNYHRLSSAKSCSDLSPSGNKQLTIMDMRNDVKINTRNGKTTCLISLEDSGVEDEEKADDCSSSGVGDSWDSCRDMQNRINKSLPGLPPLPKSLSGIEISQQQSQIQPSQPRQSNLTSSSPTDSTLDTKLAILRREMNSLRQMDLSLLSQLWVLNESIQEFRTMMQEQESFSQQSPSPSNSDLNSLASDDEELNSNQVIVTKITMTEVPKTTAKRRMNISPPAPPLSSKC